MSLDREQIRALMETAVAEGDPEFEHADAIYAWQVLALLAELEQADERERIGARNFLVQIDLRKAAESRLAKVPALVEALKDIGMNSPQGRTAEWACRRASAALTEWERE